VSDFNVGLIPDAGQFVVDKHSKFYDNYPPDLANPSLFRSFRMMIFG
jgi:hypothetical protein